MFYFIRGKVALSEPGLVVIDAGGVGYGIMTSLTSSSQAQMGDTATFYTYLHVRDSIFDLYGFISREEREDAIELFGFAEQKELDCFKQLTSVTGVGPKAALSILGVTTPSKLALAVLTDDQKVILAAPGVGKKLAQRIILELKDKIVKGGGTDSGQLFGSSSNAATEEATTALVMLGFTKANVTKAVNSVLKEKPSASLEEIIKLALKLL